MKRLAAVAALVLTTPTSAYADSALLGGLRIGGAVSSGAGRPSALHFRLGAGLDWLFARGPTLSFFADTTHEIDATFALKAGWSFPGMITGEGVPLALGVGPMFALDRTERMRAGVRFHAAWGLWMQRATIDFDVDLRRAILRSGRPREDGWEVIFGLCLRVAPWSPLRL